MHLILVCLIVLMRKIGRCTLPLPGFFHRFRGTDPAWFAPVIVLRNAVQRGLFLLAGL